MDIFRLDDHCGVFTIETGIWTISGWRTCRKSDLVLYHLAGFDSDMVRWFPRSLDLDVKR